MKPDRLFLVGPDTAGNSFLARLFQSYCGDWMTVVNMDDHGELPETVAREILRESLAKAPQRFSVINGFNRNAEQADWSATHGLLGPRSMTVILKASLLTCWNHHEREQKRRGKPFMNGSIFEHQFVVCQRHIREVELAIARAGGRLVVVSADRDTERLVFPEVLQHAEALRQSHPQQQSTPPAIALPSHAVVVPA